ncbi:MAG: NAD(P)-dependent dehydrogenase (short-subunit alcohol dehydrogenase family) [Myxococcota bacterium]|jgi:NAD(P)-dependent dehydrogenase (short-subunit alcohol dehydrogenase family)
MNNPLDFTGRAVLITGGSAGIGWRLAERFLAAGAEVMICSRRPPASLPAHDGRSARHMVADVRDSDSVVALVKAAVTQLGRLDVLINNAGGSPYALAADASPRFLDKIIQLNLTAPLLLAQQANAVMQGQEGGGVILNITSVSGTRPSPGTAAYGAAKAGLINLTATLAVEWAPRVRVCAITAGLIETEKAHLHYGSEAGINAAAGTVPLGRLGVPDDVADAALFLASPMASYISGVDLTLHGGGASPAFLTAVQAAMKGA